MNDDLSSDIKEMKDAMHDMRLTMVSKFGEIGGQIGLINVQLTAVAANQDEIKTNQKEHEAKDSERFGGLYARIDVERKDTDNKIAEHSRFAKFASAICGFVGVVFGWWINRGV